MAFQWSRLKRDSVSQAYPADSSADFSADYSEDFSAGFSADYSEDSSADFSVDFPGAAESPETLMNIPSEITAMPMICFIVIFS